MHDVPNGANRAHHPAVALRTLGPCTVDATETRRGYVALVELEAGPGSLRVGGPEPICNNGVQGTEVQRWRGGETGG